MTKTIRKQNGRRRLARPRGSALFRCNRCGKVVKRDYGWKLWSPSWCESTGNEARLYRIPAPNNKVSGGGDKKRL